MNVKEHQTLYFDTYLSTVHKQRLDVIEITSSDTESSILVMVDR